MVVKLLSANHYFLGGQISQKTADRILPAWISFLGAVAPVQQEGCLQSHPALEAPHVVAADALIGESNFFGRGYLLNPFKLKNKVGFGYVFMHSMLRS